MKTYLVIGHRETALESHLSPARTLITMGRNSEEAYNVIALDDEQTDVFQCQFSRTETGWNVQNGQWRTDCPKGIRSRLQHACNLCTGRCVNTRPAHPTYGWRMPRRATLLNGQELDSRPTPLKDGDHLLLGTTEVIVKVAPNSQLSTPPPTTARQGKQTHLFSAPSAGGDKNFPLKVCQ